MEPCETIKTYKNPEEITRLSGQTTTFRDAPATEWPDRTAAATVASWTAWEKGGAIDGEGDSMFVFLKFDSILDFGFPMKLFWCFSFQWVFLCCFWLRALKVKVGGPVHRRSAELDSVTYVARTSAAEHDTQCVLSTMCTRLYKHIYKLKFYKS